MRSGRLAQIAIAAAAIAWSALSRETARAECGDGAAVVFASPAEATLDVCPGATLAFSMARDFDGDGLDDAVDPDDDDDGRSDRDETSLVFNSDDPSGDHDRDGVPNYRDDDYWTTVLLRRGDCPDEAVPRGACDSLPSTVDFDHDDQPDHLDRDSDGDGVSDAEEDGNLDADHDGVPDPCPLVLPRWLCPRTRLPVPDTDGDGAIDSRDLDSDGDGTLDVRDPARVDPCLPSSRVLACKAGDADADGLWNGIECPDPRQCTDSNQDGTPDYQDPDQDRDGLKDGLDPAPRDPCVPNPNNLACPNGDGDGDGVANQLDPKPGDPCVPDASVLTCASGDRDGDGLDNAFECPGLHQCRDTDGDGLPDYEDSDSDNDGLPDSRECADEDTCGAADSDGDGVPDLIDPDRPELAGGACGVSRPGAGVPSLGWLLATLIAALLGRRRPGIGLRHRARKQARARNP